METEPPYVPKRSQSEIPETLEDDWTRVFPAGEILEIGDTKFRAKTHADDEPATYWQVEASDALAMWPDGAGSDEDGRDEIRRQFHSLGAIVYDE